MRYFVVFLQIMAQSHYHNSSIREKKLIALTESDSFLDKIMLYVLGKLEANQALQHQQFLQFIHKIPKITLILF